MKTIRRVVLSALLCLMTAAAYAGPQSFATNLQTIRAGVIVLPTAKPVGHLYGQSAGPFVWLNLDNALGIKPAGWSFVNPLAPGTVTPTILNEYIDILGPLSPDLPQLGAPISKLNAPYWEVDLNTATSTTLDNYDVLLINPAYYAQLNTSERSMLTRFVDQGGVLWIDTSALPTGVNGMDETNNFPLAFVDSSTNGNGISLNYESSLFNGPDPVSQNDWSLLSEVGTNTIAQVNPSAYEGAGLIAGNFLPLYAQFYRLHFVAFANGQPTAAVGQIGSGYVVVTTRGVAQALNRAAGSSYWNGVPSQDNCSFTALSPVLQADGLAAAKVAINIVSLARQYGQAGGGTRKTSSSFVDVTAPLLKRFSAETGRGATNGDQNQPVVYKGVVVASAGDHIVVFNAVPGADLDGQGTSDEGIGLTGGGVNDFLRDVSVGAPYDRIWSSVTMPGPISAPVCAEVYYQGDANHPAGYMDQVMVVDADGALHVFELFPKNSTGNLIGYAAQPELYAPIQPPGGPAQYFYNPPNAPTVDSGLAFMADSLNSGANSGRVWIVDLSTGSRMNTAGGDDWYVGGNGVTGEPLVDFTGSPTIGYIPIQDNSGGVDRVLYIPGQSVQNGAVLPTVVSLWLGVKGESPISAVVNGGVLTVTTRAASQNGLPIYFPPGSDPASSSLGIKLTLLDANGNPMSASLMKSYISGGPEDAGNGAINFPLASGVTQTSFNQVVSGVRIDYTIDWGKDPAGYTPSIYRGEMSFTEYSNMRILGNVALAADGSLFFVVSDPLGTPGVGGQFYGMKEDQGRGGFRVFERWDLYPAFSMALNQAATQNFPGVLADNDGLLQLPGIGGFLNQPLNSYAFSGGPAVEGNQVFVPVSAIKGLFLPCTILLAFSESPPTPRIPVGQLNNGFTIVQPDFARSDSQSAPNQVSTLQSGDYQYDRSTGVLEIPNLSKNIQGTVTDCLTESLPIIIRTAGQPDRLIQPEEVAGSWSPLLWYAVFNGNKSTVTPVVTGDTVFMAGSNAFPSILQTGNFLNPRALVWALDAQISPTDPWLNPTPGRPWLKQLWTLQVNGSNPNPQLTPITSDPHFKMPQADGSRTFGDWVVKLFETVLGNSSTAYGIAAGDGTFAIEGDKGVYGFSQADVTVCDEGRVSRFDAAGNPLFSTDSFLKTSVNGSDGVGRVAGLVRPAKAYDINGSEMLVVDPGSNRVVRMSSTGTFERSISSFILDPLGTPLGYRAGETTQLRDPRDAFTYSEYHRLGTTQEVTNQASVEYWVHYVIADSGNKRLLDIIDRYSVDPTTGQVGPPVVVNGVPQLGVLIWHSPVTVSGKQFSYNSVSRVWMPSPTGGRFVYVAGIGNAAPSGADLGLDQPMGTPNQIRESETGNGGIVVFDPQSQNGVLVINRIAYPDLTTTNLWDSNAGTWDTSTPDNRPSEIRNLSGVQSVTARVVIGPNGGPLLALLIADSDGVFESEIDPATFTGDTLPTPDWMMLRRSFEALRRPTEFSVPAPNNAADFRPMYARRLDSGDIMVVNGYVGQMLGGGAYSGEIMMFPGVDDPFGIAGDGYFGIGKTNLGFNPFSIDYELPPITGSFRGITAPVFADRR